MDHRERRQQATMAAEQEDDEDEAAFLGRAGKRHHGMGWQGGRHQSGGAWSPLRFEQAAPKGVGQSSKMTRIRTRPVRCAAWWRGLRVMGERAVARMTSKENRRGASQAGSHREGECVALGELRAALRNTIAVKLTLLTFTAFARVTALRGRPVWKGRPSKGTTVFSVSANSGRERDICGSGASELALQRTWTAHRTGKLSGRRAAAWGAQRTRRSGSVVPSSVTCGFRCVCTGQNAVCFLGRGLEKGRRS
ncbi:hypothetical protein ERJ75_001374400 [Trypanosoma vivax]|nr:hypothetical protein ERJ75_001374400 [Trypanosoma vivax]